MECCKQTPLAVIGMACRVPGADDLEQFWQLLVDGRCAIVEMPAARLDRDLYYDPRRGVRCKTYSSLGGTIEYRPFDASKCPVPARILPSAEVGHRELCQVAADACRHAGMNPFDLPLRNVGVYVGHNLGGAVAGDLIYATRVEQTAQYLRELERFHQAAAGAESEIVGEVVRRVRDSLPRRGPTGLPESYTHMAAAILSEAFGLNGPSMILDAACSSALQGLAMASRALRLGRIDMAIVGGASFYHVDSQMLFSNAQSASASGSFPFDERADGLVAGEGYLAILVKTLERAVADGDPVLGVIRGIGVSADGRGKSLWAPRAEGQVLAMRRAYEGGIDIDRLQFVEAHATSTRVGDLTELRALAEILGTRRSGEKIPLGGVKANIGHTLESAGLAGLVKTILAINHATIPRQIHIEQLNTGIDWDAAPFYVPTTNVPWPEPKDGHPRRGAVNSFGIGGLNVHVVVDEHRETENAGQSTRSVAGASGVVSAKGIADATSTNATEPIAIVGAGCIFPGARTLEAFWELLASGRDPKCDAPTDRWDAPPDYDLATRRPWPISTRRGGFITDFQFDWRRHKLPPKQVAQADPLQLMILDATDAALADAGYDKKPYDKTRVGVVVGTIFGSDFCEQLQMGFRLPDFCAVLGKVLRERGVAEAEIAALAEAYSDKLLEHMPALLDETGGFTPSALASRITKTYDLMGGAATVDSGSASSLAALSSAIDTLADGSCDMMICAAGHRTMGLLLYESMSLHGDLAGGDPKSPFDVGATGHVPGEGVGVVVLRRLSDARRDGDRIRGIIHAVGAGFAATRDEAVAQSIGKAYLAADVARDRTVILETSGTGRIEFDSREIAASAAGLADDARKSPVVLSTVVGRIGHTQGASGMASLMAAMGSLGKLETPPVYGATEPIPPLAAASSALRLATAPTCLKPADEKPPVLAGVNSIDSLGAAYHLVLERGVEVATAVSETPPRDSIPRNTAEPSAAETRIEMPPSTPWRIVRIGAATIDELVRLAAEAAADAQQWFARAETVRFAPKQPCRLALVARDADDLRAKLTLASQHAGTSKAAMLARNDVFVGQANERGGKVAFLFSGQGSQYPGMLKTLLDEFPPAAEAMRRVDAVLGRLNIPTFGEFAAADSQLLGKDVWFTQLSLLCADMVLFRSLQSLGIRPDFVAGHSYGEFPALTAAGALDFENAVLATRARCRAIEACAEVHGRMLSVAAPGSVLEKICEEIAGGVYPANYNSPTQTVVGGDDEAIARLESRLTAEKIACTIIPVPRPFHTPLMSPVKELLSKGLEPIVFQSPATPMVSSVTNRLVGSPDEIRENLVRQMTGPVRYVDLIEQLFERGVRAFVEVGPRQVLTSLHGKILAGRDAAVIGSDDNKRPGASRLLAVEACLDAMGLLDRPDAPRAVDIFASPSAVADSPAAAPETVVASEANGDTPGDDSADGPLVLRGTSREMGFQYGRALAVEIRRIARRYADLAGIGHDYPATAEDECARFDSLPVDVREELRGIAEGAGVSDEMLAAYNEWVDGQAVDSVSTVAAVGDGATEMLHAFDDQIASDRCWGDLAADRRLRVYRPTEGHAHAAVSPPGMVGASAGINEEGLAISSVAAVAGSPATTSIWRTALVHRVLRRAADIDGALGLLREAADRTGWEFVLSHAPTRRICRVRFAEQGEELETDRTLVVARAAVCACTSDSARAAASLATDSTSRMHEELSVLRDGFDPGATASLARTDQIRAVARSRYGVVMSPRRGEIICRRGVEGQVWVDRYRFEPPPAAGNGSSDRIAGNHGGTDGRGSPTRPEEPSRDFAVVPLRHYVAASRSIDGKPPFDQGGRVCSRFVSKMLETSVPPIDESFRELGGAALIVGSNPVGLALRKQVESLGQRAVVVPLSDDFDKTLAAVEKIWEAYRPLHLFLVTPFDDDATASLDPSDWQRRRRRGVMLPYAIAQKWFGFVSSAKLVEQASIVAATAMGGDYGLSGHVESLESGAVAGLVKGLWLEVGFTTDWAFRTKIIDAPKSEPPDQIAAAMLRELRAISFFVEIAYAGGRRYVTREMHEPVAPAAQNAPTPGRPWLITGGARGITAAVARRLGARFGVKLHLVGTSPRVEVDPAWRDLTPEGRKQLRAELAKQAVAEKKVPADAWHRVAKAIEIDKNLRDLEQAGIPTVYHVADVSDRAAMATILDRIRHSDGPIEGIVHGAGVESSCRFTKKNLDMVSRTVAAKVDGAALLMELTRDDPPRFFLGFGSIAGRWGSIGQTDYGMASDMLAKLIDWYRHQRPDCHAACFHWQPWAEIGMAAREETRGTNALQFLQLLPPAEGVEHFIDELLAGAPTPEVLVTDWDFYKRYCPDESERDLAEVYLPSVDAPPESPPESSFEPSPEPMAETAPESTPEPSPEPAAADDRVAMRHVMRVVESPWEATSRKPYCFAGPALILGDNADARALAKRLAAVGVDAREIPIHETAEQTLSELQWMWGTVAAPHLFLLTGRDDDAGRIADRESWSARRRRGVELPLLVVQKWLALVADADLLDRSSLVAVTSLGGDFGFSRPVVAPEGGALSGLVKGLYMELCATKSCGAKLRVIDAPPEEPPSRLAEAILGELDVEGSDIEVAYDGGRRHVVRMAIEPVETLPRKDIPRGGVWVVTGGARGITAAVAKELGRRFSLKLHLLGKSPAPKIDPKWREFDDGQMRALKRSLVRQATSEGKSPGAYWERVRKDLEIDRNLRELADAGVQATYHGCDLCDVDELEHALQRIRQTDGPIQGIIHGAGIQDEAKPIGELSRDELQDEVDVKIDAAWTMMRATAEDPVAYYVGFGSISGRFGSNNAVVYSMSSDMLCKLIGWWRSRRPACHAVGFHWHPWGEVGMMTRPSAQHTITVMKMRMMPPAEGSEHLIRELLAGAPESEVLITDRQYYEMFYSRDLILPSAARPGAALPAARRPRPAALIERVLETQPPRRAVAELRLDPIGDPFLREHRLRDRPLLPLVVALEAFAEVGSLLGAEDQTVVRLRDVRIPDAVRFFDDKTQDVRVVAEMTGDGVACRLVGDFVNRRGQLVQKDRLHFAAKADLSGDRATIDATLPPARGSWTDITYPQRDALLYHGPPLRLLRRLAADGDDAWGQIDLPGENELAGNRDKAGWLIPSAAIDACLYACGVYAWVRADGGVTVPESLSEIRFGRPGRPLEHCTVHVRCREMTEKLGRFDFTLFGDDGEPIFQVEGYCCHVLRGGTP